MYHAIYPGQVWLDTNGRRIQAHGGSLYYLAGKFTGMERIKKNHTRGMEFFNGESDIIHLWIYITGRMKGC